MRCEIITVGTELLLGDIVDTNSTFLAQKLARLGIDVFFQTKVGDNSKRLEEVIKIAQKRADLLIFTGGLGPTEDDLTKETLSKVLKISLYEDKVELERIKTFLQKRNIPVTDNNYKQALIPEGAKILVNPIGTASGVLLANVDKYYILLPGPPSEMKYLFTNYIQPWVKEKINGEEHIFSHTLKFIGISESKLENNLIDLFQQQTNPTLALLAKKGEIHCRLTAKVKTEREFCDKIIPIKNEILKRVGKYCYGTDDISLEEMLGMQLKKYSRTLATAESCTGGLIAERITRVPGSSGYFLGTIVSYANEIKERILKVPKHVLQTKGAVSYETALAMAKGVQELLDTDYAISVTGIAGPEGGNREKPVGLVYIAIVGPDLEICKKVFFSGNREDIRWRCSTYALNLLRLNLI